MIRDDDSSYGGSYWPSISDLFMTLFLIAVALAGSVLFVFLPSPQDANKSTVTLTTAQKLALDTKIQELEEKVSSLAKELGAAEKEKERMQQDLALCMERVVKLQDKIDTTEKENQRTDKPPIITIADADKRQFFASGSAAVSIEFEDDLRAAGFNEIASEILSRNHDGSLNVDTLEVIGHTDGIPVRKAAGNLDAALPKMLARNDTTMTGLVPGSNNDLGLLRALAIKQAWQRFVADHADRAQLESINVRTYSAGQTLPVEPGRFGGEDSRARRIELRLTKLLE